MSLFCTQRVWHGVVGQCGEARIDRVAVKRADGDLWHAAVEDIAGQSQFGAITVAAQLFAIQRSEGADVQFLAGDRQLDAIVPAPRRRECAQGKILRVQPAGGDAASMLVFTAVTRQHRHWHDATAGSAVYRCDTGGGEQPAFAGAPFGDGQSGCEKQRHDAGGSDQ